MVTMLAYCHSSVALASSSAAWVSTIACSFSWIRASSSSRLATTVFICEFK